MKFTKLDSFLSQENIELEKLIVGVTQKSVFSINTSKSICLSCLRKRFNSSFYISELMWLPITNKHILRLLTVDLSVNIKNTFFELKNNNELVKHKFLCLPNCKKNDKE